jgi:hypothetical protein
MQLPSVASHHALFNIAEKWQVYFPAVSLYPLPSFFKFRFCMCTFDFEVHNCLHLLRVFVTIGKMMFIDLLNALP